MSIRARHSRIHFSARPDFCTVRQVRFWLIPLSLLLCTSVLWAENLPALSEVTRSHQAITVQQSTTIQQSTTTQQSITAQQNTTAPEPTTLPVTDQPPYSPASLRIGMPQPGIIPFFWQDQEGRYRGIYADTLRMIATELSLTLEFIPLSQARLKRHFEQGYIDLEAGVATNHPEDARLSAVSLFTEPFSIVNEVIIYRPELSFPVFILKDLKGLRVATVRGTPVPETLTRDDFSNQWQIAQRVHRGWNDVGLMKEAVALYYQRSAQLDYIISLPYASNPVSFRLHRNQSALLDTINQTILDLKNSGRIDHLICQYLCGNTVSPVSEALPSP